MNIKINKLRKFLFREPTTLGDPVPTPLYDAFYGGLEFSEDYKSDYSNRSIPDRVSNHAYSTEPQDKKGFGRK